MPREPERAARRRSAASRLWADPRFVAAAILALRRDPLRHPHGDVADARHRRRRTGADRAEIRLELPSVLAAGSSPGLFLALGKAHRRQPRLDQPPPLSAAIGVTFGFTLRCGAAADRRPAPFGAQPPTAIAAIYMFALYSHHDLTHTRRHGARCSPPRSMSSCGSPHRRPSAGIVALGIAFGLGLHRQVELRDVRGGADARLPALSRATAGCVLTWKMRAGGHRLRIDHRADRYGGFDRRNMLDEPAISVGALAGAIRPSPIFSERLQRRLRALRSPLILYTRPLLAFLFRCSLRCPLWHGLREPRPGELSRTLVPISRC